MKRVLLTAAAVAALCFSVSSAEAADRSAASHHTMHNAPAAIQLAGGYNHRSYSRHNVHSHHGGHHGYSNRHSSHYQNHRGHSSHHHHGHNYYGGQSRQNYYGYGGHNYSNSGIGVSGRNFSLHFGF